MPPIETARVLNKADRIRILAVDDNPAALYATGRVLRSAGYDVIEVSTRTSSA